MPAAISSMFVPELPFVIMSGPSPTREARPDCGDLTVSRRAITIMLCSCRAGVIGKDAQQRTDRKLRQRRDAAGAQGQDAVLLVGLDHDQIRIRLAGHVARESVALIHCLLLGAAIPRYRHPTREDQE